MTGRRRTNLTAFALALVLWPSYSVSDLRAAEQEQATIPKTVPIFIEYARFPRSWGEALDRAELVAVVQIKKFAYDWLSGPRLPITRLDAEIVEIIKGVGEVSPGHVIPIMRYGGVREVDGVSKMSEEHNFRPWAVGQTLLVFLTWFDEAQSYMPSFGPNAAFELDPQTRKVRVFAHTTFAGRHHGRDVDTLLAEVKAAARSKRPRPRQVH